MELSTILIWVCIFLTFLLVILTILNRNKLGGSSSFINWTLLIKELQRIELEIRSRESLYDLVVNIIENDLQEKPITEVKFQELITV